MRYLFGGLIFGGAYFRNFTVLLYYTPFSPRSRRDEREEGQARHPPLAATALAKPRFCEFENRPFRAAAIYEYGVYPSCI